MKNYNPLYYLLFVLMIFGAFASIAQNDYGITVLGLCALSFAVIFLIQLITNVSKNKSRNRMEVLELFFLVVLSVILFMRVFYIRFLFVEVVFAVAGLALISIYLLRLSQAWLELRNKSTGLGLLILSFFGSIILYLVSMTIIPFVPSLAEPAGGVAFGLILIFGLGSKVNGGIVAEGERITAFDYVLRLKDRSVVLIALFLLFTAYMGFTKIGILPRMYSNEFPQAYFELVDHAEKGVEKPVDGLYRHEEFKKQYDRFVNRHVSSENK
jgi:hypothetical protein